PVALGKLVAAAGDNIQTDLSINNLLRLNELTKQTPKSSIYNVVFSYEPNGFLMKDPRGSEDALPASGDFDDIQSFVQNIFARAPLWSEQPTLVIQNGTSTPGLGGKFNNKLRLDGKDITVLAVANALTHDHATTLIIDRTNGKKPKTISYLEALLKVKASQPDATAPPATTADVLVVLGSDYAASSGSASPATSPSGTAPSAGTNGLR
ncbi:MAG TPA: LytR C-terminal domain-containing protein, partial [Candidatus Polarisedimenticolaceae bacterium]|nr:LytR C-terminal domain-containing protein [Candidatus Polarisedimenticolaceae bacterium]